jgi:hypothetical protein
MMPVLAGMLAVAVIVFCLAWPRLRPYLHWRRHCLQLAAILGLSPEQARSLWNVARRAAPELPIAVFVRPSLLQQAVVRGDLTTSAAAAMQERLFRNC